MVLFNNVFIGLVYMVIMLGSSPLCVNEGSAAIKGMEVEKSLRKIILYLKVN